MKGALCPHQMTSGPGQNNNPLQAFLSTCDLENWHTLQSLIVYALQVQRKLTYLVAGTEEQLKATAYTVYQSMNLGKVQCTSWVHYSNILAKFILQKFFECQERLFIFKIIFNISSCFRFVK